MKKMLAFVLVLMLTLCSVPAAVLAESKTVTAWGSYTFNDQTRADKLF